MRDTFGDFSFIIPVDVYGQKGFRLFPFNAENAQVHAESESQKKVKPVVDNFHGLIEQINNAAQKILDEDNVVYVDFKRKIKV